LLQLLTFDVPWIFWLPVLYLYFVPFIGFQIKYDDDDDDDGYSIEATAVRAVQCTVYSPCKTLSLFCGFR